MFSMLMRRCLVFTVAGEIAAARPDVHGPGTFRAALIDELYNLTPKVLEQHAKVKILGGSSYK